MRLKSSARIFLISLVLIVLAVLGTTGVVGFLAGFSTWLAVAGWGVMALGGLLK